MAGVSTLGASKHDKIIVYCLVSIIGVNSLTEKLCNKIEDTKIIFLVVVVSWKYITAIVCYGYLNIAL